MAVSGSQHRSAVSARRRCRLCRPIVLIGLMGAGKTSVGHRLAGRLAVPFRDSDQAIEEAAGMSVSEIFERFGESHFRDGERRVIGRLLAEGPQVLATGGGAWLSPETRAAIGAAGVSVWLRADLDVLVARTVGRTHRPLLARGDARATLARLMHERYPVYALADLAVDSLAEQSHEDMADRIVAALSAFQATAGRVILEDR